MEKHRLDRTPTASEHICESFVVSPSDSQTVEDPQMKNGTRNVMHITCGKRPSTHAAGAGKNTSLLHAFEANPGDMWG